MPPRCRGEDETTAATSAAKVVADHLRNAPDEERGWALRENPEITSAVPGISRLPNEDQFDEWAKIKVEALLGVVTGRDGTMNASLLGKIAEGERIHPPDLAELSESARPAMVKAREMVPNPQGIVRRGINWGFRRVMNPLVNMISRQPIWENEWERQWAFQEKLINGGVKDYDEGVNDALDQATQRVMRNVHNLTDRSQWTVTMRNWAPFYFAQEQAYRRMGRLLAENPRAFRQYQLMISNIANTGNAFNGKDGNGYFVFPGSGFLTGAPGVVSALSMLKVPMVNAQPIGMGWNMSASSVIFPLSAGVRPDLSPLVAVPTQALMGAVAHFLPAKLQSDATAVTDTVLGPNATESLISNLIPNTIIQRWLTGVNTGFDPRSLNSVAMQVLQNLDYENRLPNPAEMVADPNLAQQFVDRWRNQVQISYGVKAIIGALTPVSPEIQVQDWNLPTILQNDINSTGSLNKGVIKFLAAHPDATPYTVWQSTGAEGVDIPDSVAAENWIDSKMPLINNPKYGNAVLLLLPPNTNATYNANVYQEQIAQGFRVKLSPFNATGVNGEYPSYIDQLYINAGNAIVLDQWYPQYEKMLAASSGAQRAQLEQNWQTTTNNYAAQNPIWGTWWNANIKETYRGSLINQMKALLSGPDAHEVAGPIASMTRTLLSAYDAYTTTYDQDMIAGASTTELSFLTQQWKDNLEATSLAHPELVNVITGLFMSVSQPTAPVPATATGENQANPGIFTARSWRSAGGCNQYACCARPRPTAVPMTTPTTTPSLTRRDRLVANGG